MITIARKRGSYRAQVVLSNGTVAGEGAAGTRANALYFACKDAADGGYHEAACGHSRYLSERDERSIRRHVAARRR